MNFEMFKIFFANFFFCSRPTKRNENCTVSHLQSIADAAIHSTETAIGLCSWIQISTGNRRLPELHPVEYRARCYLVHIYFSPFCIAFSKIQPAFRIATQCVLGGRVCAHTRIYMDWTNWCERKGCGTRNGISKRRRIILAWRIGIVVSF